MKASDDIKIEVKPDGTVALEKQKTETKDTGNYEMIATNSLGKISSATDVKVKPSISEDLIIDKFSEKLKVTEGQPIKLTAKVEGKPEIDIFFDGIDSTTNFDSSAQRPVSEGYNLQREEVDHQRRPNMRQSYPQREQSLNGNNYGNGNSEEGMCSSNVNIIDNLIHNLCVFYVRFVFLFL